METLTHMIIPGIPDKLTPTPTNSTTPVKFNIADYQYKQHNAGFITLAAKRLLAGQRIVMECYSNSYKSTEFFLAATFHLGMTGTGQKKALRMNRMKDLEGYNSESLIPSWYPEQLTDAVAIATELAYFVKSMDYDYVREQVIPAKAAK